MCLCFKTEIFGIFHENSVMCYHLTSTVYSSPWEEGVYERTKANVEEGCGRAGDASGRGVAGAKVWWLYMGSLVVFEVPITRLGWSL